MQDNEMIAGYKVHQLAYLFPEIEAERYQRLVDDIRQNGQRLAIALYRGEIVDGRHRARACADIGREPLVTELDSDMSYTDLVLYVVSMNMSRRDMTSSQRAVVALKIEKELAADNPVGRPKKSDEETTQIFEPFSKNERSSASKAAQVTNTNRQYVSDAKKIEADAPELIEDVAAGVVTIPEAKKLAKEKPETRQAALSRVKSGKEKKVSKALKTVKREEAEAAGKAAIEKIDATEQRWTLKHGDMQTVLSEFEPESIDVVITDPPYPKEHIALYGALAEGASRLLKPGGLLLAMCGQSYLPDIMAQMDKHLHYHWMLAYLTPGGQSAQLWQRRVNTFWKPVLIFSKGEYDGDWMGDVVKSDTNDNDKRFHEWGQSESGMARLVERFSVVNDVILDPFVGAGTTGVVAVQLGRRFIGIDNDEQQIQISTGRLANCTTKIA